MKRNVFIILLLISCCFISNIFADVKKEVAAVVANFKGKLSLQQGGKGAWILARNGQFLYEGDNVRTAPNSRAGISFVNGIEIQMHSNATVKIERQDISKKGQGNSIALTFGKVWAKIIKKHTKFDLHTPVATISVRGTEYEAGVENDGKTLLKVFDGEVDVGNEYGAVKVNKNSKCAIEPGSAPGNPESMNEDDQSSWQDEGKTVGTLKIALGKDVALVKEVVDAKITVFNTDGKTYDNYTGKLVIKSDNPQLQFSEINKNVWKDSLELAQQTGVVVFQVRSMVPVSANISSIGDKLSASMVKIEVKVIASKNLKLKIKDSEGRQKELMLKFNHL